MLSYVPATRILLLLFKVVADCSLLRSSMRRRAFFSNRTIFTYTRPCVGRIIAVLRATVQVQAAYSYSLAASPAGEATVSE